MLIGLIPMETIIVYADTLSTNMRSLGGGFNLLGDQPLSILSLADYPVFNDSYDFPITRRTGTETTFYSTYINDINSYMESLTGKLDVSLVAKASGKLLTFEVSAKLGLSEKTTSSGSNNVEYCLIEAQKVTTSNTLRIGNSVSEIDDLWDNGAINSRFYEDLRQITSDDDIIAFFSNYGTHIITKYDAGAYGYVSPCIFRSLSFIPLRRGGEDLKQAFFRFDDDAERRIARRAENQESRRRCAEGYGIIVKTHLTELFYEAASFGGWRRQLDHPCK